MTLETVKKVKFIESFAPVQCSGQRYILCIVSQLLIAGETFHANFLAPFEQNNCSVNSFFCHANNTTEALDNWKRKYGSSKLDGMKRKCAHHQVQVTKTISMGNEKKLPIKKEKQFWRVLFQCFWLVNALTSYKFRCVKRCENVQDRNIWI